uniref:methenyltetrahydrofolate cyclohydrolase n=2 Tax=Hirondellea gigas TaxID=1518452 RepID=A0A2P2IFS6_9CRUS
MIKSNLLKGLLCDLKTSCVKNICTSQHARKAVVLDGKKLAKQLQAECAREVASMTSDGKTAPHLVLVQVGQDPASTIYLRNKTRAANEVGVNSTTHRLAENVTLTELLHLLQSLNDDPAVNGVLVQLPLPPQLEEKVVCNAVHPSKDVDGFHATNIGRFCMDVPCLAPCTALAVGELLRRYDIATFGLNAVVCGRSKNVGLPIALLLHGDGQRQHGLDCTTTICHRYTPPAVLRQHLSNADIVVTAAGVPNLIRGEHLKPGCCVVDVAVNRIKNKDTGRVKLVGDCHFESCVEVAGHISPVPGGVGPLTVAMLMRNTILATKQQRQLT